MADEDLQRLIVTFEASVTKFNNQMARTWGQTDQGMRNMAKNTDRAMKAMEDRTTAAANSMNKSLSSVGRSGAEMGRNIQNASFQIGDFFVQVASGQNAMRAAAQQLPQLLGGFGVWGAVAGAAVAALSSIVGSLDIFGDSSKEAADNYKKFLAAADGTEEILDAAKDSISAFQIELARTDEVTRRALVGKLQNQINDLNKQLRDTAQIINDKVTDTLDDVYAVFNSTENFPKYQQAEDELDRLGNAIQAVPTDPERWHALAEALRALAGSLDPEAAERARTWANELDQGGAKARAMAQDTASLNEQLSQVKGEATAAGDGVQSFGDKAATAITNTAELGRAVAYLRKQFGQMAVEQKTFTPSKNVNFGFIGPGKDQIIEQLKSGIPGLENVYSDAILDILDSPDFGYKITDRPDKKKSKSGSKKTPEDRAEAKSQQIQDEIEYNKQLAVAYALGEAAIRKVTAAYEALKAVRQSGLKEGTDEFNAAVERQTAENLVNLELEHRLDLMKQGKTLHESVMTDQERLTKQLTDYDEMLKEGAITYTDYERAVAKAKHQNDYLQQSIEGVGDAITAGIEGATSFADALQKIGLQLLSLVAKGLFGSGPLGGLFNNLFGVAAGGILGSPTGGAGLAGGVPSAGLGTGFRRSFAAGGPAGPGPILVGENGPEILNTAQRGYVTPAQATRRMLGGAGGNQPVQIYVSGARGNQEIAHMITVGVAEGVKQSGRNVPGIQRSYNLRFAP